MARLTRRAAASLLALSACSRRPQPSPFDHLAQSIPSLLDQHKTPGLALVIVRDAQIVWNRAFGLRDRAANAPATPATVFEAASMSKPVFAYAVMKLHERGILHLDTPLTRYTPERRLPSDPRLHLITARHVLSHTTGFQDVISSADPLKIQFTPGSQWHYSGEGYAYLQSVVNRLAGRSFTAPCATFEADLRVCATDFDDFMRTRLLAPFAMNSSGYHTIEPMRPNLARPHDPSGAPLPYRHSNGANAARYGAMGGLLTTAADYARFLIEILAPKPADDARLSIASLSEMLRPHIKVQDGPGYSIHWALGWKVAQTKELGTLISHGGDQPGFHCLAEFSPQRRSAYVLLTNGDNGHNLINAFAPALARQVHATTPNAAD